MCMCGALRRGVICFGWSGGEENKQRGREEEKAGIKDNAETRRAQRYAEKFHARKRNAWMGMPQCKESAGRNVCANSEKERTTG